MFKINLFVYINPDVLCDENCSNYRNLGLSNQVFHRPPVWVTKTEESCVRRVEDYCFVTKRKPQFKRDNKRLNHPVTGLGSDRVPTRLNELI